MDGSGAGRPGVIVRTSPGQRQPGSHCERPSGRELITRARDGAGRCSITAAACSALLVSFAAQAFDLPVVGGIGPLAEDDKRLYLEFGAYLGTDSNVRRSPEVSEQSDTALQLLGGARLAAGSERSRYDLGVQARSVRYSDSELDDLNHTELRALFGAQYDTGKLLGVLRGAYISLADPTDIEITDPLRSHLLERKRLVLAPRVDVRFTPKLELELSYALKSLEYDDAAYRFLDNEDTAFGIELRWGRRDLQWLFVHYDQGKVDYAEDVRRKDFDYGGVHAGWRAEMSRFELELGVGTSTVESSVESSVEGVGFSEDDIYAYVRSTLMLGENRSIQLGVVRNLEAASNADYKTATRLLVRYAHTLNERWRWSFNASTQSSDYSGQDTGYPSSLDHLSLGGGIQRELGSPGRMHGRLYATVAYEKRSGAPSSSDYDPSSFDYERLRFFVGVAFVR